MIVVKVTYTVKDSFVDQNIKNINTFLQDFKEMGKDFQYTIYKVGSTFTHLSQYKNEEIQATVLAVPSFKSFQQQRDDSGLLTPPQIEVLEKVGSTQE